MFRTPTILLVLLAAPAATLAPPPQSTLPIPTFPPQSTLPVSIPTPESKSPPEPKWTEVKSVRECRYRGAGKLLADVDCRLDSWGAGQLDRAGYGPATHAHEGTHMVNAMVRNADGRRVNAFYCLHGKAVVVKEPKTTIARAASFVPADLRNQRFRLYLQEQAGQWNDRPLYLLDEWVAYTNEAEVVLDQAAAGLKYEKSTDTSYGQVEFVPYALAVIAAVEQDDPGYFDTDDGKNLRAFVAWNVDRAYRQYDACQKVDGLAWKESVRSRLAAGDGPLCRLLKRLCHPFGGRLGAAWSAPAKMAPKQSTLPPMGGSVDLDYEDNLAEAVRSNRFMVTYVGGRLEFPNTFSLGLISVTKSLGGYNDGDAVVSGPWRGRHVEYAVLNRPKRDEVVRALESAQREYMADRDAAPTDRRPGVTQTTVPCPPGGN